MDKVPQGWVICYLDKLLTALESGSRPKGGVKGITTGVPSLGGEHLTYSGDFDFSSIRYVPESFAFNMKKGKVEKQDILIVKDGATTGKVSFVDQRFPYSYAVVNEHIFICRPTQVINARYLFRYLMSKLGQDEILANFKGSAQGGINLSFAPNTTVLLPPLNEQRRIVAKLEKLLAKVDACKQRLEKIPTILTRFRQSVLAAACSGRLTADWREQNPNVEPASELIRSLKTPSPENYFDIFQESCNYEIPDNWEFVPLGKLGKLTGGGTPSKSNPEFWNGTIPWISAKDMKQNRLSDSIDHITELALENSSAKIIPKFSILFVVRGMILLHTFPVAITDDIVTINQDIKALIPESIEMSEYLFIVIKSIAKNILFSTKEATHGTRKIETSILKNWAIPIPPLAEQQEIVRRVEALFQKADRIEQRYEKAKAHIDQLTQSILAKAFRGELVPQDPNDEPASVLLDRIREERANQPKAKTAKKSKAKTTKSTGKRGRKKAEPPEPPESDNSEPIQLKLPGIE